MAHKAKSLSPEQATKLCLNQQDDKDSTKFLLWDGELGVEVFDTYVGKDLISICMVIIPVYDALQVRTFGCKTSIDGGTQVTSTQWKLNNYDEAYSWLFDQFTELRRGVNGFSEIHQVDTLRYFLLK